MSIIENFRKNRQGYVSAQAPTEGVSKKENQKILDLSYLRDMLGKVLDNLKTEEEGVDKNRKYSYVWTVDIGNVLGYVDTPQWVFMIESMIEWLVDSYTAVQPNGKWELYNYEHRMETNELRRRRAVGQNQDGTPQIHESVEPRQVMVVGLQLVDIRNEKDLIYEMGRPRTRQDNGFDPEVIREMMQHGPMPKENSATPEMQVKMAEQEALLTKQSAELEHLRNQMRQNSEIMTGLLAELQNSSKASSDDSEKKTTKRRKK